MLDINMEKLLDDIDRFLEQDRCSCTAPEFEADDAFSYWSTTFTLTGFDLGIMRALLGGPQSFDALTQHVGSQGDRLSTRLLVLEEQGIVLRRDRLYCNSAAAILYMQAMGNGRAA